jgi:hypothetical protein
VTANYKSPAHASTGQAVRSTFVPAPSRFAVVPPKADSSNVASSFAIWREIAPRTLRPDKRGAQLPALEHFYVVCPAVVEDKARSGFESWWQEATTDDVLF